MQGLAAVFAILCDVVVILAEKPCNNVIHGKRQTCKVDFFMIVASVLCIRFLAVYIARKVFYTQVLEDDEEEIVDTAQGGELMLSLVNTKAIINDINKKGYDYVDVNNMEGGTDT